MTRVDVVCPVYKEEETIERFHDALVAATTELRHEISLRYIYVVDPSNDKSEAILGMIAERDSSVSVIVMSRRFGHQAALIAGIEASDADAVIMLDSDFQHPPALIPELVRHWREGADIVQALRQDDESIGFIKRVTSDAFYRVFNRLTDLAIHSGAADYRLLSRRVAEVFREHMPERNPFLRGLVVWVGYKIVYVPFAPARRLAGRSKYSISGLVIFALNGMCSFSKVPLRICIWIGLSLSVFTLTLGLLNIIIYLLFEGRGAPGWVTVIAFLALGTGINLFFLGVLGEYIGIVFDEVKRRPRYLVSKMYGARHSADPAAIGVRHEEKLKL